MTPGPAALDYLGIAATIARDLVGCELVGRLTAHRWGHRWVQLRALPGVPGQGARCCHRCGRYKLAADPRPRPRPRTRRTNHHG